MNTKVTGQRRKGSRRVLWRVDAMLPKELLAFCPACKALDVLRFSGSEMIPTRKFEQKRGGVYHSCGSRLPCRLHSSAGLARRAETDRGRLSTVSACTARHSPPHRVARPATKKSRVPAAA